MAIPGINTKMILAILGLLFAFLTLAKKGEFLIPKELLILVLLSSGVSIIALFSQVFNHTADSTYVTYIISFATWLSAAFSVCYCIRWTHGRIDVPLVIYYLTAVCVFQCILSLVIEYNPIVQRLVDSYILQGQDFLHQIHRLYGIGASLDVAGLRFSLVLTTIAYILGSGKLSTRGAYIFISSFIFITVIGNIIARTTFVGTGIGLAWIIVSAIIPKSDNSMNFFLPWIILLIIGSVISFLLYNFDYSFRELFRFAFEGFFSLFETGEWQIDSTDKLSTMVVFPESLKTWLVGDGYFANSRYDINYLGDATDRGFYMGTDIGYLRFIFYFGVIGLMLIMAVIIYSAVVCMQQFPKDKMVFVLTLLVGLTVWFKIATDAFLFFALFLSAAALKEPEKAES